MSNDITVLRASSLKTSSYYHRKNLLHNNLKNNYIKRRPSTWTCHNNKFWLSTTRHYTISPRVSRWYSQHNRRQRMSSSKSISNNNDDGSSFSQFKRQTIATISTLTTNTNSDTTTLNTATIINSHHNNHIYSSNNDNIFHTQSALFLFGFLFFPCWWIGGYYLRIQVPQDVISKMDMEEKQVMTVHPSLLANGKTSSRLFWLPADNNKSSNLADTIPLFYKWNRFMSLISIGLLLFIISLLIWYYVEY